ncbi:MAG TPA: hypothetical protein VGM90_16215 [Kofleriaceae bacterium]|jgi:hypothetical protein
MSLDWYHRVGLDPWRMSLCDEHGAAVVALGRGFRRAQPTEPGDAPPTVCAMCMASLTLDEIQRCECAVLGTSCPVHDPAPAGVLGEWTRVRCGKCATELQVPSERIAIQEGPYGVDVAVDITGWAKRNSQSVELRCPFHGPAMTYFLEYVSGPRGDDGIGEDDDNDEIDDDEEN